MAKSQQPAGPRGAQYLSLLGHGMLSVHSQRENELGGFRRSIPLYLSEKKMTPKSWQNLHLTTQRPRDLEWTIENQLVISNVIEMTIRKSPHRIIKLLLLKHDTGKKLNWKLSYYVGASTSLLLLGKGMGNPR